MNILTNIGLIVATEGPNLINDVLNKDRWEANIESIRWITDILDWFFVRIISLSGFLIVSFALMGFVFKVLYVTDRSTFDKIYEVKNARMQTAGAGTQGGGFGGIMGSLRRGVSNSGVHAGIIIQLLSYLPLDVKSAAFHNIEDSYLDNKTLFTREFPKMVFLVMLGSLIWNATYRDFVVKILNVEEVVVAAILEVNPVSVLTDVTGIKSRPQFGFEMQDDNASKGKLVIADSIYSYFVTTYKEDFTTDDSKLQLANRCAEAAENIIKGMADGDVEHAWKYQVQSHASINNPDDKKLTRSANGLKKYYNYYIKSADILMTSDNLSGKEANEYVRVGVVATKTSVALKQVPISHIEIGMNNGSTIFSILYADDSLKWSGKGPNISGLTFDERGNFNTNAINASNSYQTTINDIKGYLRQESVKNIIQEAFGAEAPGNVTVKFIPNQSFKLKVILTTSLETKGTNSDKPTDGNGTQSSIGDKLTYEDIATLKSDWEAYLKANGKKQ